MYNWEIKECQISEYKFNDKYQNGGGKFIFSNKGQTITLSVRVENKLLSDKIQAALSIGGINAKFIASGDLEMKPLKDGGTYPARILRNVEAIQSEDSVPEDDEIPF
jgi:hypothetical protein